jgi:DNA mismatch repair protein MutL
MAINVLPIHLINKIAAGEVIERPASVVKELVENALDAGATRIDIRLEDGGRRLISVRDSGSGMSQADLALAFASHATSKIAGEDDLYNIQTMGFRGEALASIASISHAHIRTRQGGSAEPGGQELEASGGDIGPVRPCAAASEGTTVTVRDLFFNTPARRKFLRSPATELGHVTDHLARLALARPDVAFSLYHNGKCVQELPAVESLAQRVGDLFGADLAAGLLPITPRRGPVRVGGLLGKPAAARGSTKWQFFFLNKRFIRDRLLAHALREAYRGLLAPSLSPVALIFLELPAPEVDVNVHPTKIEVRFRDGQAVYGEVLAALRETLNKAELAPAVRLGQDAEPPGSPSGEPDRHASLRQALADFFSAEAKKQPPPYLALPPSPRAASQSPEAGGKASQATNWQAVAQRELAHVQSWQPELALPALTPPAAAPAVSAAAIQVHNTYIVSSCQDGLLIIDQHALHERLLYNDLRRSLEAGGLSGQRLLIPQGFPVTHAEADCLARHAELLASLGIEVAPFGPSTWAVQQFPSLLIQRGVEAVPFMREIVEKLSDEQVARPEGLLAEVMAVLACHAAVKAGQPLAPEEITALLARRQEAENASACPHGRPTTLKLTLKDLEKQFRRA